MIVALWGPEKSWKTTMALTWPRPLVHFDLDVGGYDRAIWRIDPTDIESKSYPTPIQMEKLLGQTTDGVSIKFPKKIFGIKEVWQQIVIDFVAAVNRPEVATIVMDSATQLWSLCHRGRLQELQEIQVAKAKGNIDENDLRERLQPIEYAEPNDRMRTLVYTARSYGKNLVLTHYPGDIYANKVTDRGIESYKTGEVKPDGFGDTQKLVDAVIWVELDEKTSPEHPEPSVTARFTKCAIEGLGTTAVGLFIEPSYQGILDLQESMRGG